VPGNHDAYVRGIREHFPTSGLITFAATTGRPVRRGFPYLRRRGPLALIGVSTAVPTAPFMATGRLERMSNAPVGKILQQLAAEDLFRVLLIHHPPVTSPGRWAARLRVHATCWS
jgi:3',5'-cyclic AMP phosphodiesterase CpdA